MTSDGLRAIMVTKAELDMEIERLGYADRIDRNAMQAALKKLSFFNLIDVIGEITEPDWRSEVVPLPAFLHGGWRVQSVRGTGGPEDESREEQAGNRGGYGE